ncbi:hypothetical protein V5F80_24065 [Xanthobacter sp. VTT E-85239]|uniref:hypothetical protein n=1 Tax=Xanthobacteraceae TaxID=335928 RepID=UPI0037294906
MLGWQEELSAHDCATLIPIAGDAQAAALSGSCIRPKFDGILRQVEHMVRRGSPWVPQSQCLVEIDKGTHPRLISIEGARIIARGMGKLGSKNKGYIDYPASEVAAIA